MKRIIFYIKLRLYMWWYKRNLTCELCGKKINRSKIHMTHGGIDDDKGKTRFACMICYDWFRTGRKKKIVNDRINYE